MSSSIHISLAPEHVATFFGQPISNSMVSGWVVSLVLIALALVVRRGLKQTPGKLQSVFELISDALLEMMEKVIGRKDVARDLFPFIVSAFLFIVFSNLSGLLPGVGPFGVKEAEGIMPLFRAPTADLNTVIALAVCAIVYVQFLGLKYLRAKKYLGKFFNFSSPIMTFVGFIELISEFTRLISFSFRLFGNVFAGEVLITVIFYLTYTLLPYVAILPLPFFFLEIFVGVIQGFVFCFLTIVFTAMAVADHSDHDHAPALEPAVSK